MFMLMSQVFSVADAYVMIMLVLMLMPSENQPLLIPQHCIARPYGARFSQHWYAQTCGCISTT